MGVEIFIELSKISINGNKRLNKLFVFLGLIIVGSIILSGSVNAATISVTPGANAIKNAISTSHSGDTLNLAAGKYYEHNILVNKNLIITGPKNTKNIPKSVIDGQNQGRVFIIPSKVTVTFQNLQIQKGNANTDTANPNGGGIYNHGKLSIKNCILTQNSATQDGGGIDNKGIITIISYSRITNNYATFGGGIKNDGTMTIDRTIVSNNEADNSGGIDNHGSMTLTESNINNNGASMYGGGIGNSGILNMRFCCIYGNNAGDWGTAISGGDGTNAKYNWWGFNGKPVNVIDGNVKFTPWLILHVNANPTIINNGDISTITADLLHDSNGGYHNPVNGRVINGVPVKFKTTLGTIKNSLGYTFNGVSHAILYAGSLSGTAIVSAIINYQTKFTTVKIDNIPPKITSTTPKNGAKGFSKTATICIKFSEKFKSSINWSKIVVKDQYSHAVSITKSISGTTLYIKTIGKRTANTWYIVTIARTAIKDYAGNNLAANYAFKFKTGI